MAKVVSERIINNSGKSQPIPKRSDPVESEKDATKDTQPSPTGEGKAEPEPGVKKVPKPPSDAKPRKAKSIVGKTGVRIGGWLLTEKGWRLK